MAEQITISSLKFIKPKELAAQLSDPEAANKVAVVDVRDNDYIGGHIKGGTHAPVDQLDARMPELLRTFEDKERVVFHCMLSQVRGPRSALAYARAKAAADAKETQYKKDSLQDSGSGDIHKTGGQEICVLEGGFQAWESAIGGKSSLTEGYVKELWDAEIFSG